MIDVGSISREVREKEKERKAKQKAEFMASLDALATEMKLTFVEESLLSHHTVWVAVLRGKEIRIGGDVRNIKDKRIIIFDKPRNAIVFSGMFENNPTKYASCLKAYEKRVSEAAYSFI